MKQEAKHTPGPWELVENSWAITTIYAPDRQGMICELILDEDDVTEDTQEEAEAKQGANARLIAAAPDLLYCLKNFWSISNGDAESLARLQAQPTAPTGQRRLSPK